MRVGINLRLLDPGKIGGMEVYIVNLLSRMFLCDESLEYLLFVTADNSRLFSYDAARCHKHIVNHNNSNQVIKDVLKTERIDLFFCPLFVLDPLDITVPAVINIPDVQHEIFPDFFTPDTLRWRKTHCQPSAQAARAILTLSEFSKTTIVERLGVDNRKVHAIHLSAEERYGDPLDIQTREQVRNRYKLPDRFGFYPANTWPHKNHKNLLAALNLYRKNHGEPPAIVLTGSEGEGHRDLLRLIDDYHLANSITCLGYVEKDEMPYLYSLAAYLVFPSLYEGFGMPLLESMHIGCPVACSKTTSLREIGGEAALYFDPEDPEQISATIHQIMKDEPTRRRLIEKGKERVKNFSWTKTAMHTLDVFRGILEKPTFKSAGTTLSVSVITPSFNQGMFIEETIQSVLSQDYPNVEYIVVDGGSTDQTLEILKKYDGRLKWVSEPDRGQADAVNKGVRMAKSDIIGWLNSDDTYFPRAISKIAAYFKSNPGMVMVYGEGLHVSKDGGLIDRYPTLPFDLSTLAEKCFICQPTVFLRKSALAEVGYLDANLQTCMDYDLWIRIGRAYGDRIGFLSDYLANSRLHPEAKTISMREVVYREIISTVNKYYGYTPMSWLSGYIHDILEPKHLKNHTFRNQYVKLAVTAYHILKFLTKTQSLTGSLVILKFFTLNYLRNRWANPYPFSSRFADGWVSRHCELELENPMHLGNIRIEGKHLWPSKAPLLIEFKVDDLLLHEVRLTAKGSFSFGFELPKEILHRDRVRLVIDTNKTFVPRKYKINDDTRELSFVLDKVHLY